MTAHLRDLTPSDWYRLAGVGVCVLVVAGCAGWLGWLVVGT